MQCETEKEIFDNRIQNHPTNTAVDDVDDDDHSMSDLSHDYIKLDHIKGKKFLINSALEVSMPLFFLGQSMNRHRPLVHYVYPINPHMCAFHVAS